MKRLLTIVATALSVVALGSGGLANGDCLSLLCSAKKSSEFEREVKSLRARHPENAAVSDLATQLGRAADAKSKNAVVVKFFSLKSAMDESDLEKSMERRLNDGQTDKVTNADTRRLTDVFVGNAE